MVRAAGMRLLGRGSVGAVTIIAICVSGCPAERSQPGEAPDAAFSELIDAGVVDAGPATLEPTVSAQLGDGGVLPVAHRSEIDPATALTVTLPRPLKDFRLRLLDHREQVVVSDDELAADGLTYRIVPAKPLQTGRSYQLVLDAELGPVVTDQTGGTFEDWLLEFRILGEVQPDPPPPGKKPAKKKKK